MSGLLDAVLSISKPISRSAIKKNGCLTRGWNVLKSLYPSRIASSADHLIESKALRKSSFRGTAGMCQFVPSLNYLGCINETFRDTSALDDARLIWVDCE